MQADLKGLSALLLDDSACHGQSPSPSQNTNVNCALAVPEVREESVTSILEGRGIKYRHRNDDILVPNSIEEQQMKKARKVRGYVVMLDQTRSPHCLFKIQERRQREKNAKERDANSEPDFEWPPKRQHHTRPPSPRTKYVLTAILILCLIAHMIADFSSVRLR